MSDLPAGWTLVPTDELLEARIGGVWGRESGVDEVDTTVIRVADFRDDGSINYDSAPIRSVTARQLASRELRTDDILLEKSGGGTTKPVGRVVRMRLASGPVVPTNFVQLLRPNDRVVEPVFLFWWLWKSHIDGTAAQFQRATTNIRNLRTQDYLARAVPLAPLDEQQRIVAAIEEHFSRLDAADASLAAAKRRLDRMPALVLSAALHGSDSVRLADVAEVRLGRQRSPKNHTGPNMVPYLRAANVTWRGFDLSDVKSMNFAPAEVRTYELRDGDVLLSEASGSADEVGKPAVWRGQIPGCCFQNTLIRVRSEGPEPEYLHKVFLRDALNGKFAQAAPGVGIHHLGSTRLSEWRIPMPSLEEQRRIVAEVEERLSAIDALRAAIERAQRRSAALRRAVLERAFRGELVPQDPSDEPAETLLARIRAANHSSRPKA